MEVHYLQDPSVALDSVKRGLGPNGINSGGFVCLELERVDFLRSYRYKKGLY